ncbi:Ubiquitin carboxyl-terminal hydrolase 23 [Camellia lanceoleosa]|uniref:Ubiquitin carboxyl-terminal hydrolase 23 n=1 Tax=Camellia lanceoleosa TaxID=1840588 RepID=A0ACC0HXJ2_9ERIC|nr:Ubiquitin carboxyl-terminal hydrolase 23 [Camellia lanceoleosa]
MTSGTILQRILIPLMMAETLITPNSHPDESSDPPAPPSIESLFSRKVDFHPAKKPFSGFSNGSGGFRLETLNPTTISDPRRLGPGQWVQDWKILEILVFSIWLYNASHIRAFSHIFTKWEASKFLKEAEQTKKKKKIEGTSSSTQRASQRPVTLNTEQRQLEDSTQTKEKSSTKKHVSRALQLTGGSLAPKDLVSNLRCISWNFRNAKQEDAHEYMVNLLESMHKCCLPAGTPSESPSAYEKSLVHKIFGGRLRSQVKCMQCSFCSNKFDPFLDLSLEINKAESLHNATHSCILLPRNI